MQIRPNQRLEVQVVELVGEVTVVVVSSLQPHQPGSSQEVVEVEAVVLVTGWSGNLVVDGSSVEVVVVVLLAIVLLVVVIVNVEIVVVVGSLQPHQPG